MSPYNAPSDGDTRRCPQCRETLVFNSRHPVISVGMAMLRSGAPGGIRYERAWVCKNGNCDYREFEGDA